TALAGILNTPYVKSTGHSITIDFPKTATKGPASFAWRTPEWSNALERNRARTYFQAYSAGLALYFVEEALKELRAGHTKTWTPFKVPDEALSCGWTEAVRGVLSHHMVIRGGKIANYHPYPPTPWNGSVRDVYGTPGPYEDAVQNTPIFRTRPRVSRASTSCGRCAASTRACPVGSTCTSGRARSWNRCTHPRCSRTPGNRSPWWTTPESSKPGSRRCSSDSRHTAMTLARTPR